MKTSYKEIESVSLSSILTSLNTVEELIDTVCRNHNIPEDFYGNILIAVTEAVNNAIQHGNQEDPSKMVDLLIEKSEGEIKFTITDEGEGFAFDNLPDPTAPENIEKESGRGIFLMEALADEMNFEENGTKVILVFNL